MQANSYPQCIGKETKAQIHTARNWKSKELDCLLSSRVPVLSTTSELLADGGGGGGEEFLPLGRIHWVQNKPKTIASKWQGKIELVRCDPEQRSNSESFSFISATWDHSHIPPAAGLGRKACTSPHARTCSLSDSLFGPAVLSNDFPVLNTQNHTWCLTAGTPMPTYSKFSFVDVAGPHLLFFSVPVSPEPRGHVSEANAQFVLMMQEVERASWSPHYLIKLMALILCHSTHTF